MELYRVRLTEEEREDLQKLIQKGGKGYRIRHAQILLKLDYSTFAYRQLKFVSDKSR